MGKRFLITGGAGFIGSHLAERLIQAGHQVMILDDLSTGSIQNVAHLKVSNQFHLVEGSAESLEVVMSLARECDVILHLAAAVGVKLVAEDPLRTITTTIHGTEVVLKAAHALGRPVLITSSSEVYGKSTRVPFSEDDDIVMGATRFSRWSYAYSKGIDEFLAFAYHRQFNLPVMLVRLFNTVGPRQVGRYGMVLPRFVSAALAGNPLQVYGDGTQTRCFCHVADVSDAIIRLVETPAAVGEVFNLGSNEEVSMNDLARRVIRITASASGIEHVPYDKAYGREFDDLPRRVPNLRKIQQAIGFSPRYDLDQIIQSVVDNQRPS